MLYYIWLGLLYKQDKCTFTLHFINCINYNNHQYSICLCNYRQLCTLQLKVTSGVVGRIVSLSSRVTYRVRRSSLIRQQDLLQYRSSSVVKVKHTGMTGSIISNVSNGMQPKRRSGFLLPLQEEPQLCTRG